MMEKHFYICSKIIVTIKFLFDPFIDKNVITSLSDVQKDKEYYCGESITAIEKYYKYNNTGILDDDCKVINDKILLPNTLISSPLVKTFLYKNISTKTIERCIISKVSCNPETLKCSSIEFKVPYESWDNIREKDDLISDKNNISYPLQYIIYRYFYLYKDTPINKIEKTIEFDTI